jgi:hypothetical protein
MADKKSFYDRYGTPEQTFMDRITAGLMAAGGQNPMANVVAARELAQKQQAAEAQQAFMKMFGNFTPSNNGMGITGITVGADGKPSVTIGQTPEAKAEQEAKIAQVKERETAIGKAERLKTVGETIGKQWLKTSPYKGAITKTGLVPLLGMWDVIKKGAGATSAQRNDQAYANFVAGVRAQLARGMGDVGNLSEYEQRAVIQLVPNLMDSHESGMLKLGQLAQLVEDIKSTRSGKQGIDMQTFDVGGVKYNIPNDKVEAFKKAKGIK